MLNEMIILRANLMGGMNEYIKKQEDDFVLDFWRKLFPYECSEDELMKIAEVDSIWLDVVNHFNECLKWLWKD